MTKVEPSKTILVVEDDPDVRDAIALTLSMENFLVQVADSRESALAILATQSPHIIILDWFMPGMTIDDFIVSVSASHPQTAVIMISASMKLADKARQLGVKYFLPKPFEVPDLLNIAQACTRAST